MTTQPLHLSIDQLETPIGQLVFVVDADGKLHACGFTDGHRRMNRFLQHFSDVAVDGLTPESNPFGITATFARYFAGDLRALDSLEVVIAGTDFQGRVWRTLREIPCGETWSYGDLARRIGQPKAVRAVGLANGQNPICLVVPCHRVIGSNGTLTGYGGGLERKRWLLAHERALGREDQATLFA